MGGKKVIVSFMLGLSVFLFVACHDAESPETSGKGGKEIKQLAKTEETQARDTYVYKKEEWKKSYQEALDRVKGGTVPETEAPRSAKESGFAILPLSKEIYGVEAMAVLPLETRKLTEEEFLQLAYAMHEISFEELISPKYSITQKSKGWENRSYTKLEKYTELIVASLYFNEGKRSERKLNNDPASKGPVYIELSKNEGFSGKRYFIYPIAEMTREQIFEVFDVKYGDMPAYYYTPSEGQVSYQEIEDLTKRYLKEYKITEAGIDFLIPLYTYGRALGSLPRGEDFWSVGIHSLDGVDYKIQISADDGKLKNWTRLAVPYYTGEELSEEEFEKADAYVEEPSRKELKEAAKEYVEEVMLKEKVTIMSMMADISETKRYGKVFVNLSNGEDYYISIAKCDLTVRGIQLNGFP